ncbi:gamma-glutamyl-gamma-aminobutyrate hydrolase family protein [Parabacteroides sp. AD58]|uniref:Gamma-glutamyl-gamma-aminobutyrate hydrolase family protein n=1 Tax=Parabacteroides absconsus TaxID=2951805 RepID=A0ABZ2IM92_9BACT|nr:gamma-glutamyl-gamma-aminobutyrate hydrolase family protein [Parabacteroides sp. AD58]MCM6903004.1 gamma-glutamyl-gamma-aminobutyrate hydrolase family protein [Parabacteroides sp. AD58]
MNASYQMASVLDEADRFRPAESLPRIGISANRRDGQTCLAETYIQSVIQAGGAPVVIPATTDLRVLTAVVQDLDGILMSGGGDINPLFVGEEPLPALQDVDTLRDRYDLLLIRLASNRQIPLMGICRGHQMLNAAFGGTLYQDIYSQADTDVIKHSQKMAREEASHTVHLEDGCVIAVNSFHHQAVKDVAPEFVQTAVAPDGINEGMRHPEKSVFSVQWHPEAMAIHGDEEAQALFNHFIEEARIFRQAKELHQRIVTLDSHTDTPMIFPGHFNIGEKQGGKVNLPFMEEGRIDAAFMVAYIPQGERDEASLAKATAYAEERLKEVIRQEQLNPTRMGIARTPDDLLRLKQAGKKAIFLGIENGYALGKEVNNVRKFRDMGVSYITLCHNGDNDLCDSARGKGEWKGLSPLGKQMVAEMNRLGVMVDISHAAESTFYDVLACSRYPIIASHSSARALCNHPRNLTDDQLKAIAGQGGVVQLCLYKGFINEEAEKASVSDAIRHINHMVDLIGVEHVGIGSDFDGDGELIGCRASNELINITMHLLKEGYSETDISRIWGSNFLRVMRQVQSARQ